jgi:DNA-binding GntR family transcriptional regulator
VIHNKSLMESILEHLRGEIITCQLEGGRRLNEIQLSSQLNVSRPPMREAFQVLEQEHFVVSIPRKGRFVTELTAENYEKIHKARSMIENYVIDLLKEKNVRDLPMVDLTLETILRKQMPQDDPYERWHYLEAMGNFHLELVASAKNDVLTHFYGIIRFNILRYQYWLRMLRSPHLFTPDAIESLTREHSKVLALIKEGEFDEAKDCLKSHIDGTWELMKRNLLGKEPMEITHLSKITLSPVVILDG